MPRDRRADGHAGRAPARRRGDAPVRFALGRSAVAFRSVAPCGPLAILPIKSFSQAKQRLRARAERRRPARAGRRDVRRRAGGAAPRSGARADRRGQRRSRRPADRRAATARTVVEDDERGHNAAATKGIQAALEDGIERALLVPGDCPLLDPKELEELLAHPAGERSALIVPDRHGTGTNALLLTPPDVLAPSFGPDSCRRHMADAEAAGVPAEVVEVACLALDVDTPDDLEALQRHLARHPRRSRPYSGHAQPADASPVLVAGASISVTAIEGLPEVTPGRRSRRPDRDARTRTGRRIDRHRRARDRAQGRVEGRGPDPRGSADVQPGSPRDRSSRYELGQGPTPRPGDPRRVARGASRIARRPHLRHPSRVRLRQRRRRRVERSGRRRAGPAPPRPRRVRPEPASPHTQPD